MYPQTLGLFLIVLFVATRLYHLSVFVHVRVIFMPIYCLFFFLFISPMILLCIEGLEPGLFNLSVPMPYLILCPNAFLDR